jgi:hypothetical protein
LLAIFSARNSFANVFTGVLSSFKAAIFSTDTFCMHYALIYSDDFNIARVLWLVRTSIVAFSHVT